VFRFFELLVMLEERPAVVGNCKKTCGNCVIVTLDEKYEGVKDIRPTSKKK